MAAHIDLAGQSFGRLTAIHLGPPYTQPSGTKATRWMCRCECGVERLFLASHLRAGLTRSCGCLRAEMSRAPNPERRRPVVSYGQAHLRMKKARGKAAEHSCVDCGRSAIDWSYDGADPDELLQQRFDGPGVRRYSLKFEHYAPRCKPCHEAFDVLLRRRSLCESEATA